MSALAQDFPLGQIARSTQPASLRPLATALLHLPFHRLSVQELPIDLWGCREDDLPADLVADPVFLSVLSPAESTSSAARPRTCATRSFSAIGSSRRPMSKPAAWASRSMCAASALHQPALVLFA